MRENIRKLNCRENDENLENSNPIVDNNIKTNKKIKTNNNYSNNGNNTSEILIGNKWDIKKPKKIRGNIHRRNYGRKIKTGVRPISHMRNFDSESLWRNIRNTSNKKAGTINSDDNNENVMANSGKPQQFKTIIDSMVQDEVNRNNKPHRKWVNISRNSKNIVEIFVILLFLMMFLDTYSASVGAVPLPVEDRHHWYSQAQSQISELLEARRTSKGYAKNVILFIGDGMGISTVTASRILKGQKKGCNGEEYRLSFEKFPFVALSKTYTIDTQIGDSSACSTAMMCGVKGRVNTVGLDNRGKFEDCLSSYTAGATSLIDWAQKYGKSTGIVTNTRLTHGTPSALYAKSPSRYWEDDSKLPSKDITCKDIARQLVENEPGKNINVLLGGGRRHWIPTTEYDREERDQRGRRLDGRNLVDDWIHDKKTKDLNAEYVWNKAQFENIDPMNTDYLLGIFGYSHLDFESDRDRSSSGDPSLAEMTTKSIQILNKNPHGYFLMVEGGRIDHAHHHNNGRRALEEVDALDDAIEATLNMTSSSDTLVVVTADHSHVFTLGGDNTPRGHPVTGLDRELSDLDLKPYTTLLYSNGPGYAHSTPTGRQDLTGFNTLDINFVQQAAVPRKYETHGGEDVPVYAQGPGSHLFTGTIEQTYIAHAIAHAACISEDNTHCEKPPSDDACAVLSGAGSSAASRRPLTHANSGADDDHKRAGESWERSRATSLQGLKTFTLYRLLVLLSMFLVLCFH